MVTGCKPTSVRFTGLLISSQRRGQLVLPLRQGWLLSQIFKFLEGSFEPNLISKHLTSFEDWGGRSQEVVRVVCSKLLHSKGGTHGYNLQVFCR